MPAVIAKIRLASGQLGYMDEISGTYLNWTNPEREIFAGTNCTGLRRGVKSRKIILTAGSLGRPKTFTEILHKVTPPDPEPLYDTDEKKKTRKKKKEETPVVEEPQVAEEIPAPEETPVEEVPVEAPIEEIQEAPVEEVPVQEEIPQEEVPAEESAPVEEPAEEIPAEAPAPKKKRKKKS